MAPRAERGFAVPPEVPRYFASKGLRPSFSYLDVSAEEHARAFTVAKAVDLELLAAFRDSIGRAIAGGQSFETWRRQLHPDLVRLGWDRPRRVADPRRRMPDRVVNFTAPGRLQNIFSSNMRAARAAGQWERIQRTKDALPYLLYVPSTSRRPRPQHKVWWGIILHADDPFWLTHFPPNGWRCKCAVRQVSGPERGRLLREEPAADYRYTDERPILNARPVRNPRTGEVIHVPEGIDLGWERNPGLPGERARALTTSLATRVQSLGSAALPVAVERAILRRTVEQSLKSDTFRDVHRSAVEVWNQRRVLIKAERAAGSDQKAAERVAAKAHPFDHRPLPAAVLPARLDAQRGQLPLAVTVTPEAIGHSYGSHPSAPGDWEALQELLDRGEVHVSPSGDRLWALAEVAGRHWLVVLVVRGGAWRVLTYFGIKPGQRAAQLARADGVERILLFRENQDPEQI